MADQPQPVIMPYAPKPAGEGKAIASLVLGLCSALLWLCPLVGLVSSILGIIFGVQANRPHRRTMATAGLVLSIIGLLLTLVNGGVGAYTGATGRNPLVNRLLQQPPTSQTGP